MGLDGVELIMAVEEKFGIQIADEEAQEILTPRQMYEVVGRKLRAVDPKTCLSQRAFYLLRRAAGETLNVPRRMFHPDVPLEKIVPDENRQHIWHELKASVGAISWPKLKVPAAWSNTLSCMLLVITAVGYWRFVGAWEVWSFVLTVVIYLAALWAGYALLNHVQFLQTSFAGLTAGSLAEYIVAYNPQLLSPPSEAWSTERIRLVIRDIIVEQLAIDPNFSDDAEFVRDLGVD